MYSHIGSWRNTNIPPKIRLIDKVLMNFIDRPTHFSQFLLILIPIYSEYNHCSSCLGENLKGKNPKKCKHAFFLHNFFLVLLLFIIIACCYCNIISINKIVFLLLLAISSSSERVVWLGNFQWISPKSSPRAARGDEEDGLFNMMKNLAVFVISWRMCTLPYW